MDVSVPVYKPYDRRDLSRDVAMKTLPNTYSDFKNLLVKQCYPEKDALYAVKLDPAVLEARVTRQEKCRDGPIPAIIFNIKNNEVPRKSSTVLQSGDGFETMLSMQQAALQSLSSQQFDLLLKYVDTLRKQRVSVQKQMECRFCKKNGESLGWYSTHSLKDNKGRVRCPVLRALCCPRCGATGDRAHTIKYCPDSIDSLQYYGPY